MIDWSGRWTKGWDAWSTLDGVPRRGAVEVREVERRRREVKRWALLLCFTLVLLLLLWTLPAEHAG